MEERGEKGKKMARRSGQEPPAIMERRA